MNVWFFETCERTDEQKHTDKETNSQTYADTLITISHSWAK